MQKYFLFVIVGILINNLAFGQKSDTTILYFKYWDGRIFRTSSLNHANYFRVILPPDSGDNRHNIREYYKSGKPKLIGKELSGPFQFNPQNNSINFDGDCISYFENGKKSAITHFNNGNKDGFEYLYYPDGKIYCCLKHVLANSRNYSQTLLWECYDRSGNMICNNGNGEWKEFDNHFENIELEGQVINGLREGIWHGNVSKPGAISYQYVYKKGTALSSTSCDKSGVIYPFKTAVERADYRAGKLTFLDVLRSHIKIPQDVNGKKMSIDTLTVSFVVEKDGHIDEFSLSGEVDSLLKDAVFAGLRQCDHWSAYKLYGKPLRTRIIIPLKENSEYEGWNYLKFVRV